MKAVLLGDVVNLNPTISLKKGTETKFVSMDKLEPFTRKISGCEKREYKGGSKFENGDTLLARITPCLENGKTAFVDILEPNEIGAGSTEFVVMRAKDNITVPDYVYYLSISPEFRNYAIQSMVGTSGRQRVQNDSLSRLEVKLPDLNTQAKIGEFLRLLDEKIELNRRMNETLEKIGQTLFKHYFINNSEAKNWKEAPVYDFADVIYGAPFSSKMFNESGEGKPLIRIRDLKTQKPGFWTTEQHSRGTLITAGDIIVGMDAEFRPVIWSSQDSWLNQRLCLFRPKNKEVPKLFILEAIKPWLDYFERGKVGTTVIHLSKSDIDSFKVKMPPKELLKQFKDLSEPIFNQRVINSLENHSLVALRDSLLPRLISGKIEV